MAISFEVSPATHKAIMAVMLRAASLMSFESMGADRLSVTMDLTACEANGCAMDWDALLQAETGDFVHDVSGIMRHIDRRTGKLGGSFLPRYAR